MRKILSTCFYCSLWLNRKALTRDHENGRRGESRERDLNRRLAAGL